MRRRKRRILAAGMVVVITCSSYGSVPRVYANTNFYQIREIESLSEQVLYQKVPYGTRYQDLEMPDSIDVFVSGGQTEDVPDAGSDEKVRFPPVSAFSRRCDRSTGLAEKRELTRVTTALPAQSRENQMERF